MPTTMCLSYSNSNKPYINLLTFLTVESPRTNKTRKGLTFKPKRQTLSSCAE